MVASRTPIAESVWFWVCLFASMGLGGLWAIGERYDIRQTQLERQGQGRMRAAEQAAGGEMTTEISSRGHLQVSLRPLYVLLGMVVIAAWIVLWWNHLRPRTPASSSCAATPATGAASTVSTERVPASREPAA